MPALINYKLDKNKSSRDRYKITDFECIVNLSVLQLNECHVKDEKHREFNSIGRYLLSYFINCLAICESAQMRVDEISDKRTKLLGLSKMSTEKVSVNNHHFTMKLNHPIASSFI